MPGLLGLVGATGSGVAAAPALQVLTYPFLALSLLFLGRGWYLEYAHRGHWRSLWSRRALLVLMGSTALAALLWGLRFGGLLGPRPF